MKHLSGDLVRRASAVSALVAVLPLAGCGAETASTGEPSPAPSATTSPGGAETASSEPGSHADGLCGGGNFETKVVGAAKGVELTVPAEWKVKQYGGGTQIGLYPPDRGIGDGYVLIHEKNQTIDEAVSEVERSRTYADKTSEEAVELDGLAEAKMLTHADDDEGLFVVDVVAVDEDGLRVVVNMSREDPREQAVAESCLSTLARTS